MALARHKVKEVKKKTFVDHLKDSAVFILVMILLVIVDVVSFIFWLSHLLSGDPEYEGFKLVQNTPFYLFAGLGVLLGSFFLVAAVVQRRAHGS